MKLHALTQIYALFGTLSTISNWYFMCGPRRLLNVTLLSHKMQTPKLLEAVTNIFFNRQPSLRPESLRSDEHLQYCYFNQTQILLITCKVYMKDWVQREPNLSNIRCNLLLAFEKSDNRNPIPVECFRSIRYYLEVSYVTIISPNMILRKPWF